MNKFYTETLIIGAGPAGMACAMELSKAKKDFVLIERDERVGGLSKTYKFVESDGSVFYTDNGPHRFFSKNPYLYEFIGDILQDDWVKVPRQTRQFIDGKFYDYPINAPQALKNIGFLKACMIVFDYLVAKVRFGLFRRPVRNFEDYAVAHFGRTLADFNMINYTEKIWGIPASEIHPDWALQRIKGLNIFALFKDAASRAVGQKKPGPKSLVDEFYYPKNGTGHIYESIQKKLEAKKYKILFKTQPIAIKKDKDQFEVELLGSDNKKTIVNCKYLVESVPILEFVELLEVPKSKEIPIAMEKLKYRSQVYVFVTLDKDFVTLDQWIYFPSKKIPFGRISEMKNFSKFMSPVGKTSLFIELFCFEGDDLWNMAKAEILQYILPHFEELGLFSAAEIRNQYVIKQKNVYPIYDLDYKKHLSVLKNYLAHIENLFFIGRPGRFRYNNQDHSLEMGILVARGIIENKLYDIESIGEDGEYFESAKVYEKSPANI